MRFPTAFACPVAVLAAPLFSQETPRPYAGDEKREIKALSAEEIESCRAGAGMGFAKAAELRFSAAALATRAAAENVLDESPET